MSNSTGLSVLIFIRSMSNNTKQSSNSTRQNIIITMHMRTSTGQSINWSMGRVITCSMFSQTQTQTQTQTRTQKETRRHTQTHADAHADTDRHRHKHKTMYKHNYVLVDLKNCTSRSAHTQKPEHAMFLVSAFSVCKIKVFGRNASVPKHFVNETIGAQEVLCTVSCWCLVCACVCQCLCRERQKDTQIDTKTDTQTETQTDTPTDRQTDRQMDTQTHGDRLTERHTDEDAQT